MSGKYYDLTLQAGRNTPIYRQNIYDETDQGISSLDARIKLALNHLATRLRALCRQLNSHGQVNARPI